MKRILLVVGGLAVGGAVVGALTGMVVAASILALMEGPRAIVEPGIGEVYGIAASVGSACGAVLAPVASFTFMRHVPLWRIFAETALGTVIGGVIALRLNMDIYAAVGVAALGFLAAGARLAISHRKRPSAAPSERSGSAT
ncbi:MAG TPA: hypothetical protein VFT29_04980 [Gemmatimonadaceae bacterium]|nr:hypothetical protein [Gemmatimonadaceae bacterium]